jgi:hypothetical protein
MDDTIMT